MILYVLPFLATFFGFIKYEVFQIKDVGKSVLFWLVYIYLTLLIGLRYMVGGDSYFYMIYFDNISLNYIDLSWEADYQPLFYLLNYLAKLIYPSFTSFQIIHSLIINTVLFYFINKNTNNRFLALFFCLLMFYINFSVEILRESLAIMIFIINYKSYQNSKWLQYFIGVFIALMFHISALFLILLPFVKRLKLNKKYILLLITAFFVLNQLNYFFSVLENVEKIGKKVNDYSEASYGWKSTFLFFFTRTLLPISLFFWAKTKFNFNIKYEPLICSFGLLGVFSIFNTIIFIRFTNYLFPFYCISLAELLIPYFRLKVLTVQKSFVNMAFLAILLSYGYLSFYWPDKYYKKWVPYYSIFSDEANSQKFIDRDY